MRAGADVTVSRTHLRRRSPTPVQGLLIAALATVLALALSTAPQASGAPAVGAASSSAAAATEVVAIRAKINNKYVAAEDGGNSSLIANRTAIGPWETFDLIHVNSTDVYLRSHANGKYVCAESGGAAALISNRDVPALWETFQLINNSDGTKSLRARVNNKLVTAESGGGAPLIANRDVVGPWEKFDVIMLGPQSPTTSPSTTTLPASGSGGFVALGRSFPSEKTTGVPLGTTLSAYTGPCTIQTANVTIDAKIVNCDLRIFAQGVKVTRSKINGSIYADADLNVGSFTIADSWISMPPATGTGIGDVNFVASRVNVTGGSRSVNCYRDCTIQDSYVHGQYKDNRGRDHESGIRMGSNSVIRHNTIACDAPDVPPDAGCSAALTGYGDFATVQKNTIDNNLIVAGSGGYCAYGGSTAGKPYSSGVNNIKFTNNVWQRGTEMGDGGRGYVCGWWGPITSFDSNAPGNVWSNNLYDDGTPVPPAN